LKTTEHDAGHVINVINIRITLKGGFIRSQFPCNDSRISSSEIEVWKLIQLSNNFIYTNNQRAPFSYLLSRKFFSIIKFVLFTMAQDPPRQWAPHYLGFIFIFRTTAFGNNSLDEWSDRRS